MDQNPEEITFIDFKCPHCGCSVSFPETSIDSVQECPSCSQILIVPDRGIQVGATLPIPMKTSRLLLRRLASPDSGDLLELNADDESFRYIDWNPVEEQEVEDWLAKDQSTRLTENGAPLRLGIETLEHPKVVGLISLYFTNEDRRQMSFSAMMNCAHRRRGFGTEAIRGAMNFAFTGLKIHRLSASCDSRNIGALRMLDKAGLRREGQSIKAEFRKGEWVDTVWFALLREEYESIT